MQGLLRPRGGRAEEGPLVVPEEIGRAQDHAKDADGRQRPMGAEGAEQDEELTHEPDRKSTRLNSSHGYISYAVFCLKKKKNRREERDRAREHNRIRARSERA